MKQKIIVIVGPTASGKSDLSIRLAKRLEGEIISADSRQVYRGMDIGTGKVTKKGQKTVSHHLIDVANPNKQFTVNDFKKLAEKEINDISKRGRLPIVVGGTGLYIDALVYDLNFPDVPPNKKLRAQLEKMSVEELFARLRKLDAKRAQTIESKNKRRLIRALEILAAVEKVPLLDTKYHQQKPKYNVLWLGLNPVNLKQIIKKRLKERLRKGMIKEVEKLHTKGLTWKRLEELGLEYRWVSRYLQKRIDRKEMEEMLLREIINYAKRQMTWFKRNKKITWIKNPGLAIRFLFRNL